MNAKQRRTARRADCSPRPRPAKPHKPPFLAWQCAACGKGGWSSNFHAVREAQREHDRGYHNGTFPAYEDGGDRG